MRSWGWPLTTMLVAKRVYTERVHGIGASLVSTKEQNMLNILYTKSKFYVGIYR